MGENEKVMLSNINDVAEKVFGVEVNCLEKAIYRGTECGAWITWNEYGFTIGSIVEGSDVEFGKSFTFPAEKSDVENWLVELERQTSRAWLEANCETIYDLISETGNDYDVYDGTFDMSVTVSLSDDPQDYYDKFCEEICKKVRLICLNDYGNFVPVADWSGFIEKNMEKLKVFMRKHWRNQYSEYEAFTSNWISEFRAYFTGLVPEDFYETLYDLAKTLEEGDEKNYLYRESAF